MDSNPSTCDRTSEKMDGCEKVRRGEVVKAEKSRAEESRAEERMRDNLSRGGTGKAEKEEQMEKENL